MSGALRSCHGHDRLNNRVLDACYARLYNCGYVGTLPQGLPWRCRGSDNPRRPNGSDSRNLILLWYTEHDGAARYLLCRVRPPADTTQVGLPGVSSRLHGWPPSASGGARHQGYGAWAEDGGALDERFDESTS